MAVRNIEASPIYKETYRALVCAGKNKPKTTAIYLNKAYKDGLANPMDSALLMRMAKRDYQQDVLLHGGKNKKEKKTNFFKTFFKLMFNPEYRKAKKEFTTALKELYPKSYKARMQLVNSDKIQHTNNTTTRDRLSDFKIKEL